MNLRQRIQAHHAAKNEIKASKAENPKVEAPKPETPKKKFSKLYGGGNNDMTRSMRDHPTYKKPELRLVK